MKKALEVPSTTVIIILFVILIAISILLIIFFGKNISNSDAFNRYLNFPEVFK